MEILYIIGNGFDLAWGMKTSYPDFYSFLKDKDHKNNPLMRQLIQEITEKNELWSDMEEALGKFTKKIEKVDSFQKLYIDLSNYLSEYLSQQSATFNPTDLDKEKFEYDIYHPLFFLDEGDKIKIDNYFRNKYQRLTAIYGSVNYMIERGKHRIMTLNYTNTIERIGKYYDDIIHVHGTLDETIIMGVDNEGQIENEKFRVDDVKDFFVKEQSNEVMKLVRHNHCRSWIKSAELIILYGVSLGETDAQWWALIGEQFRKGIPVIQFLFSPDIDIRHHKQLVGRLERKQRQVFMEKMGFSKNRKDWPADVNERLIFVTNSEIFKPSNSINPQNYYWTFKTPL